ncbi:hypothetical protein S83_043488, partial [Arachis hypogaea]
MCVAVAPHSSTLFLFLISLRLFELYGNETKMKLLAKELAPLQNIGSQNCITFSVDGSKFSTGGSGMIMELLGIYLI